MIKQTYIDGNSILEKKFKILRMSILLGNSRNREETLREFEETAKEIDKYRKDIYEEVLSSKLYTTKTLEEEEKRLSDLIEFIEKRVNERNAFIDDYLKITNNFLDDLDRVSEEDNLASYKKRYDDIREYLSNVEEIDEINNKLEDKRHELEEKYEAKANNEVINGKLEEELIDEFNKVIINDPYYKNLNYLDIDNELLRLKNESNEKEDVMNTFISSFDALKNAGISGAEREEYLSYVQDSKNDYYKSVEKEYILSIYKLVLDKINDYDKLCVKRDEIDNIISKRDIKREKLNITDRDNLEYFKDVASEQYNVIKSQKYNIENIDKLIVDITNYEDRLDSLVESNNRSDIVSLLEEFQVDKPVIEKKDIPSEKEIHDEVINNNIISEEKKPSNMVIRIDEPTKMNIKNASDTAKLVMKKVVIVLEPKKYSNRKDKLKEAEIAIAEEKKIEEEKKDNINVDIDINTDNKDDIGIELTRHDVFTDDDEDEINNEIHVPVEINIEEPKEENVNLFKETDPFLDDNEFEINDKETTILKDNEIPKISNIGSVKPNNIINKIENLQKENDDLILPTMGITNEDNKEVPIVSENYIN